MIQLLLCLFTFANTETPKTCDSNTCEADTSSTCTATGSEVGCVCTPPMSATAVLPAIAPECTGPQPLPYCSLQGAPISGSSACALARSKCEATLPGCSGQCFDDSGNAFASCEAYYTHTNIGATPGGGCKVRSTRHCSCDN